MTARGPGVRCEYSTGVLVAGMDMLVISNADEKWDGTSRLILTAHGHGGSALQWLPNHQSLGRHAIALVQTGRYIVIALAAGGPAAWFNQAAMDEMALAVTYGRNRGAKSGKYGLMGYSMGGATVIQKSKEDAARVAGTLAWAPAADGNWIRSTGGYVPVGYSLPNNATWATEYDAAHGSFAGSAGRRIMDEAATTYHDLQVPIRIIHATDDAVVPYALAQRFVALANNPLITMRTPDIVGNHTAQFQNTPDSETVAWFDSLDWSRGAGNALINLETGDRLVDETGNRLILEGAV